jgi:hypothetical protein
MVVLRRAVEDQGMDLPAQNRAMDNIAHQQPIVAFLLSQEALEVAHVPTVAAIFEHAAPPGTCRVQLCFRRPHNRPFNMGIQRQQSFILAMLGSPVSTIPSFRSNASPLYFRLKLPHLDVRIV